MIQIGNQSARKSVDLLNGFKIKKYIERKLIAYFCQSIIHEILLASKKGYKFILSRTSACIIFAVGCVCESVCASHNLNHNCINRKPIVYVEAQLCS